MFIAIL